MSSKRVRIVFVLCDKTAIASPAQILTNLAALLEDRTPFMGELTVNAAGSICAPPSTAQAYVFNATVVPSGSLGYLTLWPDGCSQPLVSTLNVLDGAITSNMAIVPNIDASNRCYAQGYTQLILDILGYFAPALAQWDKLHCGTSGENVSYLRRAYSVRAAVRTGKSASAPFHNSRKPW